MQNPIIAALDVPSVDQAHSLIDQIGDQVGAFKVGMELFTAAGPEIIGRIRERNASVFLDLKFHDIPNTVAKAVASAVRLDVQMLTIHTHGGLTMMKAAETAAQETATKLGRTAPLVLGVSVLTSMDQSDLEEIGIQDTVPDQVAKVVNLGVNAGLRGFVCSPLEIERLRSMIPKGTKLVTPGIRMASDDKGDQKRTKSPQEALQSGADYLVIGRPIYGAPDPSGALTRILESIGS
ncbi:MAG: orotidine-5'-phosphate decarboxylase [Verrucomicrobia bacterium]|jgi:orotidine-5'-phosphate decarboxylase|nr:orotidine-5'-phosphate decarboxylase [Verrucomicrobiota bacterium]MDA7644906.1 orotidine-5'-phosphate decarboxylase [bacterium]